MARVLLVRGRYVAKAPEPVGELGTLFARLRRSAVGMGTVLAGFDVPIGLPAAYARRAGITDFAALLPRLGAGEWLDFYRVAERADEIRPCRPFYPRAPGGKRQSHLLEGLGVGSMRDLLRLCDLRHAGRGDAAPMFWTLGGKQVGKAAISGWHDLIAPALARGEIRLWPFDGTLESLLASGGVVVAETYPAEFYAPLGVRFAPGAAGERWGKRSRPGRAANAGALLRWAEETAIELAPELRTALLDGFGDGADGDDRFDAVVGLFGMLDVVLGRLPSGEPLDEQTRRVEGWMLGRPGRAAGSTIA